MNAADRTILEILAEHGGFGDSQVDHVRSWWQACGEADEGLADFLHRQGLLSGPAVQVLRHVGAGRMTQALGLTLVNPQELETLRRRLPEVAVLENSAMPNTVTLLDEADTAKDSEPATFDGPAAEMEVPRVGGMLGKYLLTDWVGEGGAGSVYRALHPSLHIPVAVKVLHPVRGEAGGERRRRLMSEARLLARLNHPNIVRVFDCEQEGPYAFLVLECVNGPNLAELLQQCGRVQPDRAVRLFRQIAGALAAAHRMGIVHRDVKPANILLTRDGTAKLADLGLATIQPGVGQETDPAAASARVGTARYLAPELAGTTRSANEWSDIYSLGATFFHALTGQPPFDGETPWEVIAHHTKTPPPSPRQIAPDVPAVLADLVVRMLSKQPDLRPSSLEWIEAVLAQEGLLSGLDAVPSRTETDSGFFRRIWQQVTGRKG